MDNLFLLVLVIAYLLVILAWKYPLQADSLFEDRIELPEARVHYIKIAIDVAEDDILL